MRRGAGLLRHGSGVKPFLHQSGRSFLLCYVSLNKCGSRQLVCEAFGASVQNGISPEPVRYGAVSGTVWVSLGAPSFLQHVEVYAWLRTPRLFPLVLPDFFFPV